MTQQKSILYVEHDKDGLERFLKAFEREGFIVETAGTAEEAAEKLKRIPFSGIILDIMMPVGTDNLKPKNVPKYMGGIKILEMILEDRFREAGNGRNTPIIVVSAVALGSVRDRIKTLLGEQFDQRYLTKPVRPRTIVNYMQQAL
ncbi:MAG: response regulator [Candidatus Hodarchaeales archaeon]|jgi:CheY-like chemotaxis protein